MQSNPVWPPPNRQSDCAESAGMGSVEVQSLSPRSEAPEASLPLKLNKGGQKVFRSSLQALKIEENEADSNKLSLDLYKSNQRLHSSRFKGPASQNPKKKVEFNNTK